MEVLSSIYTAVMSPWQPKKAEDDFDIHEDEETPEKASPVKIASFDEVDENQPTNKPSPKVSKKRSRNSSPVVLAENTRTKRSRTATKKSPVKKKSPAKHTTRKTPVKPKVKAEAVRRSSRRSTRTKQKKGFYAQSRLEKNVWTGTGSVKDPVQLF